MKNIENSRAPKKARRFYFLRDDKRICSPCFAKSEHVKAEDWNGFMKAELEHYADEKWCTEKGHE